MLINVGIYHLIGSSYYYYYSYFDDRIDIDIADIEEETDKLFNFKTNCYLSNWRLKMMSCVMCA
jgi:hypothetical protein